MRVRVPPSAPCLKECTGTDDHRFGPAFQIGYSSYHETPIHHTFDNYEEQVIYPDHFADERLLLEMRLASLSSELAVMPKEDPRYSKKEAESFAVARLLSQGS